MRHFLTTAVFTFFLLVGVLHAEAQTIGPNLIPNPGFESSTTPTGWLKGGYGANTRALSFPVTGDGGGQAARVNISAYTSGDAKWYPSYIPIKAGHRYQFSDSYKSNVPSIVDIQFKLSDGSFAYSDVANLAASSGWSRTTSSFLAPSGASSLTIFHLINQVGTLDTDNYSLNEIIPDQNNLIPNGDFETGASTPTSWSQGHWGSNSATFTYPVSGVSGSRAVRLDVTNYVSGDAKWYFNPVTLPAGIYTYTDSYISSAPSTITVQLQNLDGTYSYKDLANLSAVGSWNTSSRRFYVPSGTQNITVFHLLRQAGSLTIDNASVERSGTAGGIFSSGAVTLTFDDGWLSQYQNAFPKLKQSGVPASFYIISHQLSDFGFPGYMSQAQVKELYNAGEEIGAHTRTHPHLSQLSSSAQQNEIVGSQTDLNNLGVGPITTFAYPFGDYNDTTLGILQNSGIQGARTAIGGFADPLSDPYQLPRQGVMVTTTLSQLQQWIAQATSSKTWLILEIHEVSDNGNQFSISPALFSQLINYLVEQKVKVVTLSQGLSSLVK
jgi:peptidoglycan/xylan/chitin deacetylase (PgdA/CDA1 family)